MTHPIRTAVVAALAALTCAAPAAAQQAGPQPETITVNATGTVTPEPSDRKSNASIKTAVEAAERAATPLAIADGQARAKRLAELSGMTLGPLMAIAEAQPSPFFYTPFGQSGTFGPGRFCGTVRRAIFVTTKRGTRKRVGFRTLRTCRIPPRITATLVMTFAATPPAG